MRFGPFGRGLKPVTKEQEEEFSKTLKENKVGFKEGLIMTLTAFVTIVLPCLLILGVLSLIVLWIFGAFG
jgi:hypothetical protein